MDRLTVLFSALVAILISATAFKDAPDNGWDVTEKHAPMHWKQEDLPLMIVVHPTAEQWLPAIVLAAAHWNALVGCDLFQPSLDMHEEAIIYVNSAPGVVPVFGFDALHCDARAPLACMPRTMQRVNDDTGEFVATPVLLPVAQWNSEFKEKSWWIVVHELGHVLGLAHDADGFESIMAPKLDIRRDDMPEITKSDIERVRAAYCS